jgi:putative DNA-invertase from lambdoid prophage Rac
MIRAALYTRVSTRDQKSIPDQLADLRRYASLKDFEVVAQYEEQQSGKRDTRPVRYDLLKRAWKREFDVVLVWKLDRWGRNVQDLVNTVTDLGNHGVAFVSFSDNIDLTTANGRLFFHMLCAFAQFERETIVDRVRAGVQKKRERWKEIGRPWGRPPKAREKSAEVVALAKEGKTKSEIAKHLKISRASVIRILRDACKMT